MKELREAIMDATDQIAFFNSLKNRIFYASRDGLAIVLRDLLNLVDDKDTRNMLINEEFDETDGQKITPLVIAARNGRYSVCSMLLKNFSPDIEKECVVKVDGHLIHGATALWCAAGSAPINVVKLLVKSGADVNHKTRTSSTPLRAACFDGRLTVIRYLVAHNADINLANMYNNTCLMIAAYRGFSHVVKFLLANGADVNDNAHCGATALHYAAECGHVDICSQLLDAGAVLKKNEFEMTPVTTAAERTRENVVKLFLERPGLLTKKEHIDALELLGASFANDKENYSLAKAHCHLLTAMELRFEDPNQVIRKPFLPPIPAYENWIECQTVAELQAIRHNHNSLHMEALTIRERLLCKRCPEVAHPVVFRGAVCADNGRFDRCESLWLHALKLRQCNKLSVQRDLLRFAQVFSQIFHLHLSLRFQNILAVTACCILELEINKEKMLNPGPKDDVELILEEYELNIVTVLYILTIITKCLKNPEVELDDEDVKLVYKYVVQMHKMDLKLRDHQTLLHLACNGISPVDDFHTNDVCRFPCVDTVKLLLHCGANVTAVDYCRNTPLHTLTSTAQANRGTFEETIKNVEAIAAMLVEAGVHVDAVNSDGLKASQVTAMGLVEHRMKTYEKRETNLQCLASRCVAKHNINYMGNIPKHLETFVHLHCADKVVPD